jgi:hypothetical protein
MIPYPSPSKIQNSIGGYFPVMLYIAVHHQIFTLHNLLILTNTFIFPANKKQPFNFTFFKRPNGPNILETLPMIH